MSSVENERQTLHTRLLDAVRACQTHLGGRKEMVTESSSWVSCLCTQLEAVLQHQLKSTTAKGLSISTLKQAAVGPVVEESTFWLFVKNHLTKHEVERFDSMSNITSDVGRGRAWIRSSLNEHSLDRYFLLLLSDFTILRNYYEPDAFMLDEEKTSTLPQMAAGLGSIYFNIKFNDSSLNRSLKPTPPVNPGFIPSLISGSTSLISKDVKPVNDSVLEAHCVVKPKKRGGKKKKANIISFGDDDDEAVPGQGTVTPAEKGGPGFVVIRQQSLMKSTASIASDSSSGIVSTDGQLHGCDQRSKLDTNSSPFQNENTVDNQANLVEQNNRLANLHIHSGDVALDPNVKLPNKDIPSTEEASIPSAIETPKKDDSLPNNELSQASRDLLAVRHPSVLSSHDLVMDDWSVRSNSVAGTPLAETAPVELHPMQDDCESVSSDSRSAQDRSTSSASLVLSLANKTSNHSWMKNTAENSILDTKDKETMDADELRQALVALMHRKDELAEANRSMRSLLDSEMEHSATLRSEIERYQMDLKRQKEDLTTLQQQHIRENEVLRNQLKKYVRAVQALQRGDTDVEMPGDLPRGANEAHDMESEVYEQKLVEVAEMHGELMEFNERLHVRLQSALSLLHNMKTELVDLRGPMPNDDLISRIENDNIAETSDYSPPLSRALINIWIPSSFLKGKGANSHHLFQVYIRIGDEEWNVYRRYSQFHELHLQLRKKYLILDSYGFPPKKVMGNKGKKFVEDRRKGLQLYLRLLMNNVVQNHEKIVAKPTKSTLTTLLPFFSESLDSSDDSHKKLKKSRRTGI